MKKTLNEEKKRICNIMLKLNRPLNEWYDDEYFEKPKPSHGIGKFENIDWQVLYDQLMINTELLAARKWVDRNLSVANVGDFTDEEGMLSMEELQHLEDFDLVYVHDGFPIIDDGKYKDFNAFKTKAAEIWDKEAPLSDKSAKDDSEAPYLRGREPES